MKQMLAGLMALLVLFTASCNDDDLQQGKNRRRGARTRGRGTSEDLSWVRDQAEVEKDFGDELSALEKGSGATDGASGSEFKEHLTKEILAAMDNNVQAQTTEWGCGKVSSALAIAAALYKKDGKVDRKKIPKVNIPEDYPLAVDLKLADVTKLFPGADEVLRKTGFPTEHLADGEYVRVGALPTKIAEYLKTKLSGTGVTPTLVQSAALDKDSLINAIRAGFGKGMPSIFLHRIDDKKDDLRLHYAVAVGFSASDGNVLYMDTSPQGKGRLKTMTAEKLLERMDLSEVKKSLKKLMNSNPEDIPKVPRDKVPAGWIGKPVSKILEDLGPVLKGKGRVPNMPDIDAIETYNMITF